MKQYFHLGRRPDLRAGKKGRYNKGKSGCEGRKAGQRWEGGQEDMK